MYVISKEEARELNEQATMAMLKQKLRKSVQMSGTAQPMPQTQQRYPSNRDWQLAAGAKQDARVEAAQQIADSQNPVYGGASRGESVPSSGIQEPLMESGPVNPANPLVQSPLNEEDPAGARLRELVRLEEARNQAKLTYRESKRQLKEAQEADRIALENEATVHRLEAKLEELRAKSAELPPPAEGATPEDAPEPETQSPYSLDQIDEANGNPPGKLAASPGRSGSSGVYNVGGAIINLDHTPTLQKGFEKMNRTLVTVCKICGVDCSTEGGDEAHFKKSGHNSFRKI